MSASAEFWICKTCGVEQARADGVCAICADERQYVTAAGQVWTTLEELEQIGTHGTVRELEPDLFGVRAEPGVGIGQQAHLAVTPVGNVLWDPVGYVDDKFAAAVAELGDVVAVTASHPHMFGVQVQWSRLLGGVPVLVSEPNLEWVKRTDPAIESWSGTREVVPGVTLHQLGGHFSGSAVLHWAAGAGGAGVLLISDTIHANPDRATVTFLRSYPNRIPLSPAVVERLTSAVEAMPFDRVYDNFGRTIAAGAKAAIRRSADRYIGWVRGDFDHLT